jgi:hypothetical protein
MTFELEADGVRFWCSSPKWTQKLVEKGARLVDASQAEYLRGELDSTDRSLRPAAGGEPQARS